MSTERSKLSALVVCQFLEQRIRLTKLLEHSPEIREVASAHNLDEALLLLTTTGPWDIVLVDDRYSESESAKFIEELRASHGGGGSTLIQAVSDSSLDKNLVAGAMILGFHGFLCAPYSVDSVGEAVRLARRVREQNSKIRLKAATGLMLADTLGEENHTDGEAADPWQQVQQTWDAYKQTTGVSLTLSVVDALHKLSPTKRLPGYSGVSDRVRRLFKSKYFPD